MPAMQPPAIEAPAPAADAEAQKDITVRARIAAEREQARAFTGELLAPPVLGQLGRWTTPVCVGVYGVDEPIAARVSARVGQVARQAGLQVADAPCRPNLAIAFASNSQSFVRQLLNRQPRLLARFSTTDVKQIRDERRPVVWWKQHTPMNGRSEAPIGASAAMLTAGQFTNNSIGASENMITTTSYNGGTLIGTNLSMSVTAAVAIVDVTLATGKTLSQVADYVALVTLAPIQYPVEPAAAPSLLTLFTADAPPELTRWDKAFLSASQNFQMDRKATKQRRAVMLNIAQELKSEGEE